MNKNRMLQKQSERGSARLKFIIVMVVFAIVVYAGYLYVPVAYDAYYFKDVMQNKVDMAATQGFETTWVRARLSITSRRKPSLRRPVATTTGSKCACNLPGRFHSSRLLTTTNSTTRPRAQLL